jgi:hypothetical protein
LKFIFYFRFFKAFFLTFLTRNLLNDAGQGGNSPHLQLHSPFTGRSEGPILPPAQSFTDPFAVLQDYRFGPAGGFSTRGKTTCVYFFLLENLGFSQTNFDWDIPYSE